MRIAWGWDDKIALNLKGRGRFTLCARWATTAPTLWVTWKVEASWEGFLEAEAGKAGPPEAHLHFQEHMANVVYLDNIRDSDIEGISTALIIAARMGGVI